MNSFIAQTIDTVIDFDEEIGTAIKDELNRQGRNLELIASENVVSPAVLAAMGSVLTNKYAEGYPSKRHYGGCENVDVIETIAISRAKALFGAEHANVQPHAGVQANIAAYMALLKPGDRVLGLDLNSGGHLSHGHTSNISGIVYEFASYGLREDGYIDYDALETKAHQYKPKMIVAGASAYPRIIDFERIAKVASGIGAYFMCDIAHIAGLIAGGQHPSPVGLADVVTTTTHKTLRGPRGGLILSKDVHQGVIDKAIFPGTQGGPLMHVIAGKAVCFKEAMTDSFNEYQRKIVENAATLAEALKSYNIELVSGGTDNHLILIDTKSFGMSGKEIETKLDSVYITANKNPIPGDLKNGLRLGTPTITSRGFGKEEILKVAEFINMVIVDFDGNKNKVRAEVEKLCKQFPIYA
jgi:glycine hydroxymethyltransferase